MQQHMLVCVIESKCLFIFGLTKTEKIFRLYREASVFKNKVKNRDLNLTRMFTLIDSVVLVVHVAEDMVQGKQWAVVIQTIKETVFI